MKTTLRTIKSDEAQADNKAVIEKLQAKIERLKHNPPTKKDIDLPKPEYGRLPLKVTDSGDWHVFGLCGDTHMCCREERLSELHNFYTLMAAEGIETVLHAGNIVDGYVEKINGDSVFSSTVDGQAQYVIDNYPSRNGMTTYFITGDDHEGWWQKSGFNFGGYLEMLARDQGRFDLRYIGHVESDVELKGSKASTIIKVQHPGGGCFTEGAEILTKDRGWVDFKELNQSDMVATKTKDTDEFQWQLPTEIINKEYAGPVYTFKARTFNFTVTPEHGLWARRQRNFTERNKPSPVPQCGAIQWSSCGGLSEA